jgi:hypothetical protein
MIEDWMTVGSLTAPDGLKLSFKDVDLNEGFDEFTEAMKRLTLETQTVTFVMNDLTATFIELLTGGWVLSWRVGVKPMAPGMVVWDGRRRRHRRKR